jgi:hydroxymethylbilane synthase
MERALLERLGGGCLVPIGVHAAIDGARYRVNAIIAAVDGSSYLHKSASGTFADEAGAIARARELADTMLDEGGRSLVEAFAATAGRG